MIAVSKSEVHLTPSPQFQDHVKVKYWILILHFKHLIEVAVTFSSEAHLDFEKYFSKSPTVRAHSSSWAAEMSTWMWQFDNFSDVLDHTYNEFTFTGAL